MVQYEIMLLFDVQIPEEERNEKIDDIKTIIKNCEKSDILKAVDLGIKQLAYPVNKRTNGYFYLIYFSSIPASIQKINSKVKYVEGVLRYLLVTSDEDLAAAQADEELKAKKKAEEAERRRKTAEAAEQAVKEKSAQTNLSTSVQTASDEDAEDENNDDIAVDSDDIKVDSSDEDENKE